MLYSRLSALDKILDHKQYKSFLQCLSKFSPQSKLSVSQISFQSSIDSSIVSKALNELVRLNYLDYSFAIRCPECGLFITSKKELYEIEKIQTCYHCEEDFEIDSKDIELVYTFKEYPFGIGQQKKETIQSVENSDSSVARFADTLSHFLNNNNIDFNKLFFNPTNEEYSELKKLYDAVFKDNSTTKEKGDTLEELAILLFSLCKHFNVSSLRINPNQIDCYVRNTLFIPGISNSECTDSFTIECKNEKQAPKVSYVNKIHSILKKSGGKFGIIVSKCKAPYTFINLSNQIFLADKIIIISIDKDDLGSIIIKKNNLLECIERKITEVKINSTTDLVECGLYNA